MGNVHRLQVLLESELRRNLQFSFENLVNETTPDANTLRRGDRIRFRIVVRNDADVPFRRVAGFASGTKFVSFTPLRFEILDLRPHEEAVLGTVDATVTADASSFEGSDWMARLSVVATAALESITIQDAERYVPYIGPRRARGPAATSPRSIPLSN